ncbi:MAG: TrpB-like pyridoxal-phosphate dependent enzyme, partial [Proteobacteria bacterium]|nr:TrpB-like pyridoxal-phosphate dependent enzyme [Pseudomonadota bacterium]
ILFNWSGHGLVDMAAYEAYMSGKLVDHTLAEDEIQRALENIASLPRPKQYTG